MPNRRHILVVDDDADVLDYFRDVLMAGGHRVTTVPTGEEALVILGAGPVDLIIADWRMPGMDGLTLCRAVKLTEGLNKIPFILMTGVVFDGLEGFHKGIQAGADHFFSKPIDPADFLIRVQAVIDRSKGET